MTPSLKIVFDGRYIFDTRGGVAGLRQYSTQLLVALSQVAPTNSYLLYLRQAVPQAGFSDNPVVAWLKAATPTAKPHLRLVSGRLANRWTLPTALWFQTSLPWALRHDQPDVLHCPDFLAPFWNFSSKIPKVITIHDLNVLRFRQNFTFRTYWAWRLQAQISGRRADLILTDSYASQRDIVDLLHVSVSKVRVIPLAPDPTLEPASPDEIERVKAKFGLQDYVLWVGSLMPQKNLERLLHAFAQLKARYDITHKLVLGGQSAWGSQSYRALIANLGLENQVLLPGFIASQDLAALYSGADLFVFPSLYEGFGLPPLEAMACGCPVAISNVSSLPEVGGEAAEYFDPLDVEAIATAMQRVLSDATRREQLRRLGLAQAAQFTWQATAHQTLAAYAEAIAKQKLI